MLTIHDLIPLIHQNGFQIPIQLVFLRMTYRNALDAALSRSESAKRDIQKFYGINEKKIDVVYSAPGSLFKCKTTRSKCDKIPITEKSYCISFNT